MKYHIIATREGVWDRRISFYGREMLGLGFNIAMPLEFKLFDKSKDGLVQDPFLTIELEAAQELMDSLWDCGLRPTEGSGSAGALAATQKHLEDMRKLVFEK